MFCTGILPAVRSRTARAPQHREHLADGRPHGARHLTLGSPAAAARQQREEKAMSKAVDRVWRVSLSRPGKEQVLEWVLVVAASMEEATGIARQESAEDGRGPLEAIGAERLPNRVITRRPGARRVRAA
jgi:hypothetical protein